MKKNLELTKLEFIYYVGMFLYLIKMWSFITTIVTFSVTFNLLLISFITILFLFKIFFTKNSLKEFLLILLLSIFILFISSRIGNYDFLLTILAIIASFKTDIRKTIKFLLVINCIMLGIHLLYSLFIYLYDKNELLYYLHDGMKRYSLFTRHPNYLGAIIFWCLCGYIYINFNKKNIILIILTSVITFIITGSKTTLIAFVILLLFILFKNKISTKKIRSMILPTFIVLLSFSYFYMTNYNNNTFNVILNNLDNFLTNRVRFSSIAYENFGLTFFGQKIITDNIYILNSNHINKLIIDSFYVSCMVEYGIVYLLLLFVAVLKVLKKLDKKELIFFELFLIICFTERYIVFLTLAFPSLFLCKCFERNEKVDENSNLNK